MTRSLGGYAPDVDDSASALRPHYLEGFPDAVEHPCDVGADDSVPFLTAQRLDRVAFDGSGVVN